MEAEKTRAKILIVDDEKINIDILVDLLKLVYRTIAAKSGEQALKRLARAPLPDLILLDIMMPGIDGYEICRRIRSDTNTSHIPIIFLTAKSDPKDIIEGFRAGAVDYVTKPFQPEELKARVHTHVQLKQTICELKRALAEIETLKGMLPICCSCKKIRDDQGYWNQIEGYIMARSQAEFTHSICPDCATMLYPELSLKID